MIDIKKIREDIDAYKQICKNKNKDVDVDRLLKLDDQRKEFQKKLDDMKFQQKELAAKKDYEWAKALKWEIQEIESEYNLIVEEFDKLILNMPNTSLHPWVPIGRDEIENVVLKNVWEVPSFDFDIIDHMTLMKKYDMVDVERWVKLAWARSYFLKWDWMLLEQAVLQYSLKKLVKK